MMYSFFFAFYLRYKKQKYENNYEKHINEYEKCKKVHNHDLCRIHSPT
jgi:hypothetical protein